MGTSHFLLLLQEEKTSTLIDLVDGLDRYASRHLKATDSIRAYYILKALIQIPKCSFKREKIEAKARPWLIKLEAASRNQQDADLELVPFGGGC